MNGTKLRAGGEVSRQSHKLEELGASLRPAIYNMRVYPTGFTVQEKDKDKMRPFWKELGVWV